MTKGIITPDQRIRVFVSSTLQELSEERLAVKEAILSLNLIPVMFELGARPYPPRDLYTAYLQQSHIFIGLYWQQYGWVAPDMSVSGLEDEFNLSTEMPRLIYLKEPALARSSELNRMIDHIRQSGVSYRSFRHPSDLKSLVINDLAILLTERFELSMEQRSRSLESDALNEDFPIPPVPLIGRENVIRDIMERFNKNGFRLVTLTGAGGMGKTRVGLEVIRRQKMEAHFQVCFIPLASIDQYENVPDVMLRTAFPSANGSGAPLQLLMNLIGDRKIFLVLDNFEHLIEARLYVSSLLQNCPNLKILVTSRELLHITGENEYSLRPLSLNPMKMESPESGVLSDSVLLFLQKARGIHPDFELSPKNIQAINEICHNLDGIPLAIELAAARTRILSPEKIAVLLKENLDLLKGGSHDMPLRHQALRSTVEWSFNLLNEKEQDLLCRLAIFKGGATLEAASAVGSDFLDIQRLWDFPRKGFYKSDSVKPPVSEKFSEFNFLEAIESLLSKSLIHTSVNKYGVLRINFYQTIRHFCLEKLSFKDPEDQAQYNQLIYYLYLAESSWYQLKSGLAEEVYESLDDDIDNIESAMEWSTQTDPIIGLRIAIALSEYWDTRGHFHKVDQWMIKFFTLIPDYLNSSEPIALISKLEWSRSLFRLAEFERAWVLSDECELAARSTGDLHLLADAITLKTLINVYAGKNDRKEALMEEGIELSRSIGYEMALLDAIQHKAGDLIFGGDVNKGISIALESLELAKKLQAKRWEAIAHIFLGFGYFRMGQLQDSATHFKETLRCTTKLNDQLLPVYSLLGLCQITLTKHDIVQTCLFMGAVDTFINKPGTSLVPIVLQIHKMLMEQLHALPEDQLSVLMTEGQKLKLNDAIELALNYDMNEELAQ